MKKELLFKILIPVLAVVLVVGSVGIYRAMTANNETEPVLNDTLNNEEENDREQLSEEELESEEEEKVDSVTDESEEEALNAGGRFRGVDVKVKGLYLTGWTVGNPSNVEKYINLANRTEINAYVIDIKDEDGYVSYESNVPKVRELGTWKRKFNVDKVLPQFHENDIYIIGRIVVNKDPLLSSKKPELAVQHVNGGLWRDNKGLTWVDPFNEGAWQYTIDIAKEAVEKGFDEIQFDYIRFANDGIRGNMDFSRYTKERHETIDRFLEFAREQMPDVVLSADTFGIISESESDGRNLGQNLKTIGKNIDYLSPMIYPSHYARGQKINGIPFPKPDLDPYGVVYNALLSTRKVIESEDGYDVRIRPYLQDFTASWLGAGNFQRYGAIQAREQIQAVYDAGYEEWLFWNANNIYSEEAFLKLEN